MAVKAKGEISFETSSGAYTIVFDFNALVELEEALDVPASEFNEVLAAGRVKDIRTVFRVGLMRHHPGITDAEAGDVIQDIGPGKVGQLIGDAFTAAFPEAKEDGKASARPPRRKRSTPTTS